VRARPLERGELGLGGFRLAVDATLRAAGPCQLGRRRRLGLDPGRRSIVILPIDLRAKVLVGPPEEILIAIVDASGSMAARRMGAAKTAAARLLAGPERGRGTTAAARRRRRRAVVGLVLVSGARAELTVPLTRGAARLARTALEAAPAGGGTPLAHGLLLARSAIEAQARRAGSRGGEPPVRGRQPRGAAGRGDRGGWGPRGRGGRGVPSSRPHRVCGGASLAQPPLDRPTPFPSPPSSFAARSGGRATRAAVAVITDGRANIPLVVSRAAPAGARGASPDVIESPLPRAAVRAEAAAALRALADRRTGALAGATLDVVVFDTDPEAAARWFRRHDHEDDVVAPAGGDPPGLELAKGGGVGYAPLPLGAGGDAASKRVSSFLRGRAGG